MSSLRIRYQTMEFAGVDIHVRSLRDRQQFLDEDGAAEKLGISSALWPLFGVVWDSGEVLAHLMFDFEIAGKRILEVGCGMALASLVLNHRLADITATDYHPEAGNFLLENVLLNKGAVIPFVRTGWGDGDSGLGGFDLVIGSDLLYERSHVELLAGFIDRHANPRCEAILVDPGRGHHACFSKKMVSLGYSHSQSKPAHSNYLAKPFKGQILRYSRS
ncbi:MAG: histidine kinase [Proteobacteria bacterium]|nr:histidine kinase [Pseudomonadota bacterium]MBU1736506.1 histidine kinase [Pseudomonadota bacterium]